jgi:Cysteine rich repeat
MHAMKTKAILGIICGVMFLCVLSAGAQQNLVESVTNGCKAELDTYCKDVMPGESRILACLYAHNDKLSGKCEFALYDAAAQLERAVAALSYVANECADDLDQFCRDVPAGEGRLLMCLEKNDNKVSRRCKEALKEVGLKE